MFLLYFHNTPRVYPYLPTYHYVLGSIKTPRAHRDRGERQIRNCCGLNYKIIEGEEIVNSFRETCARGSEESDVLAFHVPIHDFYVRLGPITFGRTACASAFGRRSRTERKRYLRKCGRLRLVVRQRRQVKTRCLAKDERIYYIYYGYVRTAGPRIKDHFISARVIIPWAVTACVCGRLCWQPRVTTPRTCCTYCSRFSFTFCLFYSWLCENNAWLWLFNIFHV